MIGWVKERIKRFRAQAESLPAFDGMYDDADDGNFSNDAKGPTESLLLQVRRIADNNVHARRFVRLAQQHIVGPEGNRIVVRPATESPLAERASESITSAWESAKDFFDLRGRSWQEHQTAWLSGYLVDGEVITNFRRGEAGLTIRYIDPVTIDYSDNDLEPQGGLQVVMGIEVDAEGRPRWYRVTDNAVRGNRPFRRINANRIIHSFAFPSQQAVRGMPWLLSAIPYINLMNDYDNAYLDGIVRNAKFSGMITVPENASPDDRRAAMNSASRIDDSIIFGSPGMELHGDNVRFDGASYESTRRGIIESVSEAANTSYHALTTDVSRGNYASLRVGWTEDEAFYKSMQGVLQKYIRRVFEEWLGLASRVHGVPLQYVAMFDRLCRVDFRAPVMNPIDPRYTTQANVMMLNAGLVSRRELIENSGRDADAVFAEIESERAIFGSAEVDDSDATQDDSDDSDDDSDDSDDDAE